MRLLNVGCGGVRPGDPWTNLDDLHQQLAVGEASRTQLDSEPNYVNHILLESPLPFADDTFSGILLSHVVEHFDAQEAVKLLKDCRRVLQPGGVILASVPDASYFRAVYPQDCNENWPRLFEVTDPNNPIPTFFEAALFFEQHKQVLTEDALWSLLVRAGFSEPWVRTEFEGEIGIIPAWSNGNGDINFPKEELGKSTLTAMLQYINRLPFSLVMAATK